MAVGLTLALVACGGGDSGSSGAAAAGAIHFDVPASKPLSQLSSSEALAVCRAASAGVSKTAADPEVVRFYCTQYGVLAAGSMSGVDVAACKEKLAACIADPRHEGSLLAVRSMHIVCDPARVADEFSGCAATVGDVQACSNASLASIRGLIGMLSCESAASSSNPLRAYNSLPTLSGAAANVLAKPAIAECSPLFAKCEAFDLGFTSPPDSASGCDDTCTTAKNGMCEDGGQGSHSLSCGLGTDCTDCGMRLPPD